MFVLAAGLLGLIVLLAALQYRWLGQISADAAGADERDLRDNASAFAEDFDRELNRAYLLFQVAPAAADDNLASQVAARYDRWMATSQYPRMVKDVYVTGAASGLQHFNPATRFLEPAAWPAPLDAVRRSLAGDGTAQGGGSATLVHSPVPALWPRRPGGRRLGADGLHRSGDGRRARRDAAVASVVLRPGAQKR